MSLIKALERKACPVTKKIMWSISLKPSQWPFLWLLTVTFPHRIIPGTSPLMSLDWKKSYKVVQEPWVPWYRFFVGCVVWFVFLWVLHCSAKVPENRAVKKKKEMVAHLSVLSKGTCARNLLQRCKFSHQKEITWQHLLPECGGRLQPSFSIKQMLLPACDPSLAPLCRNGFLQTCLIQ